MGRIYYINFLGTRCPHKHETHEAALQCALETLRHLRENDPDRYERVIETDEQTAAESLVRSRAV